MKKEDTALQSALERISQIAAFHVCYIEDPEVLAKCFKDRSAFLSYDIDDESYTLYSTKAALRKSIIRAADVIERRCAIASGIGVNKTVGEEGRA